MNISPRFMADLRDRLSLSEIVGRRVKLARAGREYKGCCPFHREKTASFYVNDDKQFYHCFGCGAHGDAVGFLMQHDNLSFIEAVEILAAQAGMQVPRPTPEEAAKAEQQKSLHALIEDATRFFEDQLRQPSARDALSYLHERGMPDEMLEAFRVGFAPADGQAVRKHLAGKGYSDDEMVEAGVIRRSDKGREPYAFFRDRIMFPVADRRGRVVAFGGRILPEHLRPPENSDFKAPKYINSSDTPLFHKGRMLYSESRARQAASDGQPVIVVEGYMDVMACYKAGFKGAVAPLGTALTEDQIAALWKLITAEYKAPVLSFDGDNAGQRAAARACERLLPLLKPNHSARFAFLPQGHDPDSLIRDEGKAAFAALIDNAMPLVDFLWMHHTAGRQFITPEEKAGLAKTLDDEANRIADRGVQQYYKQAFKERLYEFTRPVRAVSARDTRPASFGGGGSSGGRGRFKGGAPLVKPGVPVARPLKETGNHQRAIILLAAVINHPAICGAVEDHLGHIRMPQERLDSLRQAVLNLLGADPALDRDALHTHLSSRGFAEELDIVLSDKVYTHGGFARPTADEGEVLEKWQEIWHFMQQESLGRELKGAGQALAHDLSVESEEKWRALHEVHKAHRE